MQISVVGLDIAKQVFQVHAADVDGRPVAQLGLRRAQVLDYFRALPPCLVGMEACATAHHWTRDLSAWPCGSSHAAGLREALRQAQ